MQMRLPVLLRIANSRLENVFCLFYKLPVQINRVVRDTPCGIILAEDVIRGLFIVVVHLRRVRFALLRQLVRSSAVAALIRLMRLDG